MKLYDELKQIQKWIGSKDHELLTMIEQRIRRKLPEMLAQATFVNEQQPTRDVLNSYRPEGAPAILGLLDLTTAVTSDLQRRLEEAQSLGRTLRSDLLNAEIQASLRDV